ncbi:MAG: hypothetical protein ACI8TX_002937 [Hyphomicrobiaceae bacterium]|jgi:hypothetical protein
MSSSIPPRAKQRTRVQPLALFACVVSSAAILIATCELTQAADTPDALEAVVGQELRENQISREIQARIDELAADTDAMAAQYRGSLQSARQLEVYNRQYEALIRGQELEMASLRSQSDEVTVVSRQIFPLMEKMIEALGAFVSLDVPFLASERNERVAGLRELMKRADVTMSEKYRRILESYQVENEYGRTIEAYRGPIETEGEARTVDYLRIGRNALLYQTLDGEESGVWNHKERRWEKIDGFRNPIRQGLRMARKQSAPDLIQVPIAAAQVLR